MRLVEEVALARVRLRRSLATETITR
jgi:hypothetical protein